ncbi:hypothetical protein [Microbacterium hydrocarbonoxydans]|uniref:hypothetical protein n=1 Tax=Microbacterium hydrocarbonoxydans TaxID=273678 RepID=UPI003D972CCD
MRTIARTVRSRAPGRSDVYTGRGKRTRIAPFTKLDGVDGARLIAAVDPHTALTVGVAAMSTNRFTPGTAELQQKLTASGSPWIGQDLRIGNSRSTGLFHTSGIGDPDDLLLPFTWSLVVPTLAIVCSRPTPAGAELLMFAHPSPSRSFGREHEVRPLMAKAYTRMQHDFSLRNALLQHEPIAHVTDETCPASLAFITRHLGWD